MSMEEVRSAGGLPASGMRISIVGVGRAGNNVLSRAIGGGISPSNCIAVNTDRGQLSRSLAQNKVLLAEETENEREGARQTTKFLQLSAHRVSPFTQESDFTILVTGLGGATGTGTAPLIAQWNRTQIRPVVSVVAIPFIHERERRFIALRGLKKMVEACDCTIIIDNAIEKEPSPYSERAADETASIAVRSLSEVVAMGGPRIRQKIVDTLSLGQIATICTACLGPGDTVQSKVVDALKTPSANVPLAQAKGAILLYRGPDALSTVQAARAYETIASLIGHDVKFVQGSVRRPSEPTLSIFLSGYSYDMTVGAFVDFIEDLYDLEYGQESACTRIGFRIPMFQMEES